MGSSISLCVESGSTFSLVQAVRQGDLRTINHRLNQDPDMLMYRSIGDRETVWHLAASGGSETVLEALAAHVPRMTQEPAMQTLLNCRNDKGQTPLMHAAGVGHIAAVVWLLQQGADPWAQDRCGKRSALHYAAMRGRTACIQVLLDHFSSVQDARRYIDVRSISGLTPLHYAAATRQTDAVRLLLQRGADMLAINRVGHAYDLINAPSCTTPLHVSAAHNDINTALALLQHYHHHLASPSYPDPRRRLDGMGRAPHRVALARGASSLLAELLHPSSNLEAMFARNGSSSSGGGDDARHCVPRLAVLAATVVRLQLLEDITHAEKVIMDFRKAHPCGSPTCMLTCQTPFLTPDTDFRIPGRPFRDRTQRSDQPPAPPPESIGAAPPAAESTAEAAVSYPRQEGSCCPPSSAHCQPTAANGNCNIGTCCPDTEVGSRGRCRASKEGPRTAGSQVGSREGSKEWSAGGEGGSFLHRRSTESNGRPGLWRFSREHALSPLSTAGMSPAGAAGVSIAPLLRPLRMSLPPPASAPPVPPPTTAAAATLASATPAAALVPPCCPVRDPGPFVRRSAGYVDTLYARAPVLPVCQCTVCLDDAYCLVMEPCHHRLCAHCARDVTMRAGVMPPPCPVCRLGTHQFTSPVCV